MRNITVSVPDEVYRRARVRAAERDRSVSSLVREYLESLGDADGEFARLEALQQRVRGEIGQFRAGHRLSRDELHDRALR
jgi:plasmid stability protein